MTLTLQLWTVELCSLYYPWPFPVSFIFFNTAHSIQFCLCFTQFPFLHLCFCLFVCPVFVYWSRLKINRFQSQIRELNAGRNLHEKMTQFKKSVPLMAKLQNDSLRDRHWLHLMKKTGYHFSTNADKFRLSDMFKMNLYKHQVIHKFTKQFLIYCAIQM